jgi:hypothetical protein
MDEHLEHMPRERLQVVYAKRDLALFSSHSRGIAIKLPGVTSTNRYTHHFPSSRGVASFSRRIMKASQRLIGAGTD